MIQYGHASVCFFERYGDHRDLHVRTRSFPTRRSSDLSACHSSFDCSLRSRSPRTAPSSFPRKRESSTATEKRKTLNHRGHGENRALFLDRKSTRLKSSH